MYCVKNNEKSILRKNKKIKNENINTRVLNKINQIILNDFSLIIKINIKLPCKITA